MRCAGEPGNGRWRSAYLPYATLGAGQIGRNADLHSRRLGRAGSTNAGEHMDVRERPAGRAEGMRRVQRDV